MLLIITALGVFISMALVDLGKRLYIQYYIIYSKVKKKCWLYGFYWNRCNVITLLRMTVNKVLDLPVPLLSGSSSNIAVQSKEGQFLRQTDLFIWDEALMAPRYALEIMDRTLKDIMSNDLLFGDKIVILGGDFRQLLPRSIRSEVINLSIKSSILWNVSHKF